MTSFPLCLWSSLNNHWKWKYLDQNFNFMLNYFNLEEQISMSACKVNRVCNVQDTMICIEIIKFSERSSVIAHDIFVCLRQYSDSSERVLHINTLYCLRHSAVFLCPAYHSSSKVTPIPTVLPPRLARISFHLGVWKMFPDKWK